MNIVATHAGDDSDGKIWGIEGMNIVFILASVLLGIGLTLMLARHHSLPFSAGAGATPFVITVGYVFGLRQGKPKSYDTDLLETVAAGTGWMPPAQQHRNPFHLHENS